MILLGVSVVAFTGTMQAAEKAEANFGDDVRLAPFVVNGKPLSISIHARTAEDRRYAGQFAEEVVGIAYETIGKSTGAGLVVIGRKGEPHPVVVMRKFLAMAAAGQLDPAVAARTGELTAWMQDWKTTLHLEEDPNEKGFKVTFDMLVPALPLPLEGIASKLYQLSWAEGFDEARVERRLRSLTAADLASDVLSKYDWVFYLPPRDAFEGVLADVMKRGLKHDHVGLFKRAAVKSALFVFRPAIKTAVEGMRKGMLFMTVLRAESDYSREDILFLTRAYANVMMPNFKFDGGSERQRALAAIEKQKAANAEYAQDPFVSPARLMTFDPADYAGFEGEYSAEKGKTTHWFKRDGETYTWQYKDQKPRIFYPAGGRRFVKADGTMTIEFQVDAEGGVTGVEERWVRRRQTIRRK